MKTGFERFIQREAAFIQHNHVITERRPTMKLEFNRFIDIHANPDRVWSVNSEHFSEIHLWSRNVEFSEPLPGRPVGDAKCAGRVCRIPGVGVVHEELSYFDNASRSLTLNVVKGLPFFVRNAEFNTRVVELSENRSRFEVNQIMEIMFFPGVLLFPMLKPKLGKAIDEILSDIKDFAESGRTLVVGT